AHLPPFLQIGTGAEGAGAAAGDHHRAILTGKVMAEHVAEGLERGEIERVAPLFPLDGEDQGAILATDLERSRRHAATIAFSAGRARGKSPFGLAKFPSLRWRRGY